MKGDQTESCRSYIPDMLTSIQVVPERVTRHLRPTGRPFIRDMYSCRRSKKGNKTKFSLARFVARGAAEYSEVHLKSRHAKILEIEPRLTHF